MAKNGKSQRKDATVIVVRDGCAGWPSLGYDHPALAGRAGFSER
jgi:hypothetical protein